MKKETKPKKTRKTGQSSNYYVTNADLLREIQISRTNNKMTNELGRMLELLCKRYASIGRFANYTYREDMQAFALMTLCKVWKSFDPAKSNNPFAYFTQITHHAFFQYDNMERKQRDIRDALLVDQGKNPSFNYSDRMTDVDFDGMDAMEVHDMFDPHNFEKDASEAVDITDSYMSDFYDKSSSEEKSVDLLDDEIPVKSLDSVFDEIEDNEDA